MAEVPLRPACFLFLPGPLGFGSYQRTGEGRDSRASRKGRNWKGSSRRDLRGNLHFAFHRGRKLLEATVRRRDYSVPSLRLPKRLGDLVQPTSLPRPRRLRSSSLSGTQAGKRWLERLRACLPLASSAALVVGGLEPKFHPNAFPSPKCLDITLGSPPPRRNQESQRMASTSARSGDKKDIRSSQAAASLGGGQKLSCSEEFLTRISTELTDEALFIARSRLSPLPNKEKNTKDQGTQISRHGERSPSSSRDQSLTHSQP